MESNKISKNEKMDELNEIKKILENKQDNDILYSKLKDLKSMEISYDDLYNTKIGKTINSLTKSKDDRIKEISNKLLISWKKIVKNKSNPTTESSTKGNLKEKDSKIPANEKKIISDKSRKKNFKKYLKL